MLSEQEKKEMLADGLSRERRQGFRMASRQKPNGSRSLNDYIAFLTEVQMFKPFEHKAGMTKASKNIL